MSPRPTVSAGDVERVAETVSDRLRHLAPPRLAPVEAEVAALLDELAVVSRRSEGLDPLPRPPVSARAFGDVVAVLAHDVVEAASAGSASATQALGDVHALLVALRRLLP